MLNRLRAAVRAAEKSFGPDDHRTLAARLALGCGLREHCREEDSYAGLAALADDCERVLGPEHPDTLTARYEAARSCQVLHVLRVEPDPARLPRAIGWLEEVAAVRERLLGPTHPDTLAAWSLLSQVYATAGRPESAVLDERVMAGLRQVAADRERELGPDDLDTLYARLDVAGRLGFEASRAVRQEIATTWGRLAAELAVTHGPLHPDTIEAREQHAWGQRWFGRDDDEVRLMEELTADLLSGLGPADARTLHAQVQLASRYAEGGHDRAAAAELAERIIGDVARVLGPEHDDLGQVRAVLTLFHHAAGRPEEAAALVARYPLPDDEDDDL
jgi:hypothetical protein